MQVVLAAYAWRAENTVLGVPAVKQKWKPLLTDEEQDAQYRAVIAQGRANLEVHGGINSVRSKPAAIVLCYSHMIMPAIIIRNDESCATLLTLLTAHPCAVCTRNLLAYCSHLLSRCKLDLFAIEMTPLPSLTTDMGTVDQEVTAPTWTALGPRSLAWLGYSRCLYSVKHTACMSDTH